MKSKEELLQTLPRTQWGDRSRGKKIKFQKILLWIRAVKKRNDDQNEVKKPQILTCRRSKVDSEILVYEAFLLWVILCFPFSSRRRCRKILQFSHEEQRRPIDNPLFHCRRQISVISSRRRQISVISSRNLEIQERERESELD